MGQCYSVEAHFKFKNNNPSSFCQIIKDEIADRNGKSAIFDLDRGDLNDPFGCFKIMTAKDAVQSTDGTWYADFSGSYGWESVMIEIFQHAAEELDDGSVITIYPDYDSTEIAVKNGKVVTSYIESEDDDKDEDDEE